MFKYAQLQGSKVVALSELHSEVVNPVLIALDDNGEKNGRRVRLGDIWNGSEFAPDPEV